MDIATELASDNLLTAQMRRNRPLRFTLCWSTMFNTLKKIPQIEIRNLKSARFLIFSYLLICFCFSMNPAVHKVKVLQSPPSSQNLPEVFQVCSPIELITNTRQHDVKSKSHNLIYHWKFIFCKYLKSLIENLLLQIFMKDNFKCLYAHREQIHKES